MCELPLNLERGSPSVPGSPRQASSSVQGSSPYVCSRSNLTALILQLPTRVMTAPESSGVLSALHFCGQRSPQHLTPWAVHAHHFFFKTKRALLYVFNHEYSPTRLVPKAFLTVPFSAFHTQIPLTTEVLLHGAQLSEHQRRSSEIQVNGRK